MKHTKGPWNIANNFRYTGRIMAGDDIVVEMPHHSHGVGCENCEANAALIASAPDLLSALVSIYNFANLETLLKTKYSSVTVSMIMQQMADAIAKAQGLGGAE